MDSPGNNPPTPAHPDEARRVELIAGPLCGLVIDWAPQWVSCELTFQPLPSSDETAQATYVLEATRTTARYAGTMTHPANA